MNMAEEQLLSSIPLKIGLIESPPYIYKNSRGDITGYEYDIIDKIANDNNLNVEYEYIPEEGRKYTYNEMIDKLAQGEYDIISGGITNTYERSKIVLFSSPHSVDIASFYYLSDKSNKVGDVDISKYTEILYTIMYIFVFIIIVSIVLSIIHYSIVPSHISYRESLWRVVATLFGEPGFILNPKLNEKIYKVSSHGLIIRSVLIFISGLIGIFLTSYTTSSIVSANLKSKPFNDIDYLYGKKIAVIRGQSYETLLNHYRDKFDFDIVAIDNPSGDTYEVLSDYVYNNQEEVDAFYMNSGLTSHKDKTKQFERGDAILEKDFLAFAFNRRHASLVNMFNISLNRLRDSKTLKELCNTYFKKNQDVCIQ